VTRTPTRRKHSEDSWQFADLHLNAILQKLASIMPNEFQEERQYFALCGSRLHQALPALRAHLSWVLRTEETQNLLRTIDPQELKAHLAGRTWHLASSIFAGRTPCMHKPREFKPHERAQAPQTRPGRSCVLRFTSARVLKTKKRRCAWRQSSQAQYDSNSTLHTAHYFMCAIHCHKCSSCRLPRAFPLSKYKRHSTSTSLRSPQSAVRGLGTAGPLAACSLWLLLSALLLDSTLPSPLPSRNPRSSEA
jgi:hypothetical protein